MNLDSLMVFHERFVHPMPGDLLMRKRQYSWDPDAKKTILVVHVRADSFSTDDPNTFICHVLWWDGFIYQFSRKFLNRHWNLVASC